MTVPGSSEVLYKLLTIMVPLWRRGLGAPPSLAPSPLPSGPPPGPALGAPGAAPMGQWAGRPLAPEAEHAWKDRQLLRVGASAAAQCVGLTGFFQGSAEVEALFLKHLYQDLPHVLAADAARLGVRLLTEEEELEQLLGLSGSAEALQEAAGGEAASSEGAQSARRRVAALCAGDVERGLLSEEEASQLEQGLSKEICCSFGRRHEAAGLEAYERQTGRRVGCRNDAYLAWPLPETEAAPDPPPLAPWAGVPRSLQAAGANGSCDGGGGGSGLGKQLAARVLEAQACSSCKRRWSSTLSAGPAVGCPPRSRRRLSPSGGTGDAADSASSPSGASAASAFRSAASGAAARPRRLARGEGARLLVCGMVDGVAGEGEGRLVVEVKHRVGRLQEAPGVRDCVQLCLYCRMLGCSAGDLVQCRRGDGAPEVLVTRVLRAGAHDAGWRDVVRPRPLGRKGKGGCCEWGHPRNSEGLSMKA